MIGDRLIVSLFAGGLKSGSKIISWVTHKQQGPAVPKGSYTHCDSSVHKIIVVRKETIIYAC